LEPLTGGLPRGSVDEQQSLGPIRFATPREVERPPGESKSLTHAACPCTGVVNGYEDARYIDGAGTVMGRAGGGRESSSGQNPSIRYWGIRG
jgi:hypothetical protein